MEDEQQLFLIEFLVDKVKIPVIRAMHDELLPSTTCVSFQILSLPPLDIHQESSIEGCACDEGDTQVFRKGKSCLFALPTVVLQKPLTSFPINMSVYKKLPPGVLPDVMLIGSHRIEAKDLMNLLLSQHIFNSGTPCKTLKDIFTITTATGQCVGSVTVFIRASCFGKKIVTQFQIPHNRKPYLFKGTDAGPVFQCKRIPPCLLTPAPLKCTCITKKYNDGSGEAPERTCCQTPVARPMEAAPVTNRFKQPDWGPRPCCPSRQSSPGPLISAYRQKQQLAPFANCPPCCAPQVEQTQHSKLSRSGAAEGKCFPCSAPPVMSPTKAQNDTCAPCCGVSGSPVASKGYKAFSDLLSKEVAVRKCGCAVKDDYKCNCGQTK